MASGSVALAYAAGVGRARLGQALLGGGARRAPADARKGKEPR
jgi:hypothetical protein